jgi:transcriptional regulator with XRE-family HTH domain
MLRENYNIKQKDLAMMLNVSPSVLSKYENEQIEPPNLILIKIAEIFNVTVDYILGNSDFIITDEERELVVNYRTLNEYQKGYIRGFLDGNFLK